MTKPRLQSHLSCPFFNHPPLSLPPGSSNQPHIPKRSVCYSLSHPTPSHSPQCSSLLSHLSNPIHPTNPLKHHDPWEASLPHPGFHQPLSRLLRPACARLRSVYRRLSSILQALGGRAFIFHPMPGPQGIQEFSEHLLKSWVLYFLRCSPLTWLRSCLWVLSYMKFVFASLPSQMPPRSCAMVQWPPMTKLCLFLSVWKLPILCK